MKQIYPNRFKDKVMIITGSARGIGTATALRARKAQSWSWPTAWKKKAGRYWTN